MADPYLDPKTGVLRNNRGITDPTELQEAEAQISLAKMVRLAEKPVQGAFDMAHYQAVHKELFGDVYPWAGEIRSIEVTKATGFCHVGRLPDFSRDIFRGLAKNNYLRGLDQQAFTEKAADLYSDLTTLHPFREGNGRTLRTFLSQVAEQAGYRIDWSGMEVKENAQIAFAALRRDNQVVEAWLAPRISPTRSGATSPVHERTKRAPAIPLCRTSAGSYRCRQHVLHHFEPAAHHL